MRDENKCPNCGGDMVPRKSKFGIFWGCKNYPSCTGSRDSQGRSKAERQEWKRKEAESKGEEHYEDVNSGLEVDRDSGRSITSFNKRKS